MARLIDRMQALELDRLAKLVQAELLDKGYRRGCILGTRITMNVCRVMGLRAYPVVCELMVFNDAAIELLQHDVTLDSPGGIEAWDRAGAYSIGIGVHGTPSDPQYDWVGHLVCGVEDQWLVDTTAAQASRPDRGIVVGTVVAPTPPGFLKSKAPLIGRFQAGHTLIYKRRGRDTSYRDLIDWRDPERYQAPTDRVIAAMGVPA